jgi:hypothetical protein
MLRVTMVKQPSTMRADSTKKQPIMPTRLGHTRFTPDLPRTKRPWRTWKSTARSNRLRFGLEAAPVGGLFHRRYPIIGTTGLFQLKSGRTSAPRLPQGEEMKRASTSVSRTSSGQWSPLIAVEWLQVESEQ